MASGHELSIPKVSAPVIFRRKTAFSRRSSHPKKNGVPAIIPPAAGLRCFLEVAIAFAFRT
ncbi:MAG: hypothetical protein BWY42_00002 [Candidatus Omnitrophica bacterium ADurb.Bin277]|nr:MAG: hypothetical protein BWY42_00002 [Candidatus Omnitrophica bacterium ADurb.Bin277]